MIAREYMIDKLSKISTEQSHSDEATSCISGQKLPGFYETWRFITVFTI